MITTFKSKYCTRCASRINIMLTVDDGFTSTKSWAFTFFRYVCGRGVRTTITKGLCILTRLTNGMSIVDMILSLCTEMDGKNYNMTAARVCCGLVERSRTSVLYILDDLNIYGYKIAKVFLADCNQDYDVFMMTMAQAFIDKYKEVTEEVGFQDRRRGTEFL